MFKQTLQQQQQFRDSVYIKYSKKGYYTKKYRNIVQGKLLKFISKIKSISILKDNN